MFTSSKGWTGAWALVLALGLSACQTTSNVGVGQWKSLGESANQNVRHELDTASIQKNGNVVTYKTRTTVRDVRLETTPNLPVFKTALNTYQMQCRERSYRIVATELFNDQNVLVLKQVFDAKAIPANLVTAGSAAQKQYDVVCDN